MIQPQDYDWKEISRKLDKTFFYDHELDTLSERKLNTKFIYRNITRPGKTYIDKYTSPPTGYFFGEDVC